jgi:hypothetical protein
VPSPPYAFMVRPGATSDTVVCIATSLRVGRCGVRILAGSRGFSFVLNVQTTFGAHPAAYSVGTGGTSFPAIKQPGV